jgi:F-type H+-transporting ATPase subunit b
MRAALPEMDETMLKKLLASLAVMAVIALGNTTALAQAGVQHLQTRAVEGMLAAEAPQPGLLDLNVGAILWVLVIFIVLAFILYRTAWKNVLAGLKARESRIRGDIAAAETARAKAEQMLLQYNAQLAAAEERARELLARATADGERLATQIRTHAQQEAEESRERAVREIDAARRQALAEIYEQTATLATSIAEKILQRNLNADDQRDLVAKSLEQIQQVGKN